MAIDSKHPSYAAIAPDWEMLRDFYSGPQKVRDGGEKYLPATSGMRIDGLGQGEPGYYAYAAYRDRAHVPDYVKEAVEIIVGLLHQKDAQVELPPAMEYLRTKASSIGESLAALHRRISVQQVTTGRLGLLVDMKENPDPTNPNPYIALYVAESIINWDDNTDTDSFGSLNLVVLDESGNKRQSDFNWKKIIKYRVLDLKESEGASSQFRSGSFSDDTGNISFLEDNMMTPQIRGSGLAFIPFVFINTKDLLSEPDEPPLKGLVELCKGIYQSEADYRQNLYMQAQETLVVIGGVKNPGGTPGQPDAIRTGAGARIDVDTGGDAKYIGVKSDGLSEQRIALENDRRRAGIKAGELIQNNGSQMESGNALSTRFNAQTATLNQLATTAAAGLELVLRYIAEWMGLDKEQVKVTPNTEFIDFSIDGANFKALMEARDMGFPVSLESLHALAADRGITVMDFVNEMKKIEAEDAELLKKQIEKAKALIEIQPKPAPGQPSPPGTPKPATPKPAKSASQKK